MTGRQCDVKLVVMETEKSGTYKQRTLEAEIRRISRNFKTLLLFFRDEKKHEIDLLIHKDGLFYPVEIKKHGTPSLVDIGAFKIFGNLEKPGFGCELCLAVKIQPLDRDVLAMSIWDI
jgi:hypothetical protein